MNNIVQSIILAVCFICPHFWAPQARAQSGPDLRDSINQRFERQVTNVFQEKVFLHLDRTSYITGENIWLSAYCVDAAFHTPADLSKVLNVELLDDSGQPVKQTRIRLIDGFGKGQLFVSPEIPSGHYLLRSYTNWMKNFPSDFVFQRYIKIVNPSSTRDDESPDPIPESSVDFFPEGGHLVAGLKSKVAVKVTDGFGNGLTVSGIVYDQLDNEVTEFTTSELGYSYFYLTPERRMTYSARIEMDSTIKKFSLPSVEETGVTLSVTTDKAANFLISMAQIGTFQDQGYLVVHTRGIIKKLIPIDLKQAQEIIIKPGELAEGISHITLLNREFIPLCERLIFNYPDEKSIININLNKYEFGNREKVDLSLGTNEQLMPNDLAYVSVAVYRAGASEQKTDNIISNLLLTSDLAGVIPNPWTFFDPENRSRASQLDLVMLTNGWRRFDWNSIKSKTTLSLKYPAEINAPILSGQVRRNASGSLPKSLQVSFLGKASVMNSVGLNSDGLFFLEVPFRIDNDKVLFFIHDDTLGSNQVSVTSPFDLEPSQTRDCAEFPPEWKQYLETLNTNIQISQVYRDYNHINGVPPDIEQISTAFYGIPDNLYILDNYTRFETIQDLFIEYIRTAVIRDNRRSSGFHVINNNGVMPEKALTLIDGVPVLDFDFAVNFDPLKVEKVGVVNSIYRMGNAEYSGIIEFTTYTGNFDEQELPEYIVQKVYHGLQQPRIFYAPDYSLNQAQFKRIPDVRNTLYWNPQVEVGSAATELGFYTSDDKGLYQVELNGITRSGIPVYIMSSFEVK